MGVKADINILKELFWNMSDKLFKRWTWEYIFRPKQVLNCFQEAAKEIWFKFLSNFQDKIAQKSYISFSNIHTILGRPCPACMSVWGPSGGCSRNIIIDV